MKSTFLNCLYAVDQSVEEVERDAKDCYTNLCLIEYLSYYSVIFFFIIIIYIVVQAFNFFVKVLDVFYEEWDAC